MNDLVLNKFDDIEDTKLRAYNRYVFFHNLFCDLGHNAARQYAELFTEKDKQQMFLVGLMVKKMGVKKTIEMVTKDVEFQSV